MQDETQERTEGPTPNNGAYAIAYFQDDAGKAVPKSQAAKVIVVEYDSAGNSIHRTYADIGDRPQRE